MTLADLELTTQTRLPLNLQASTSLCLPNAWIKGVCHHTWLEHSYVQTTIPALKRTSSLRAEPSLCVCSSLITVAMTKYSFKTTLRGKGFIFLLKIPSDSPSLLGSQSRNLKQLVTVKSGGKPMHGYLVVLSSVSPNLLQGPHPGNGAPTTIRQTFPP